VLKPGGSALIHLPMHIFPDVNHRFCAIARSAYQAFTWMSTIKAAIRRSLQHLGGKPYMHGISYEMQKLVSDLRDVGFGQIHLACVTVGGAPAPHTCVLIQKPDPSGI
ncbi:MAG TPA: hypothetical protein VGV37_02555, partial [Aliidongia sp.]|uniref:hypothetical protein n=1 Tax=Aliidongia sp. TaxID=1914230 RepID=UPI002DDD8B22